MASVLEKVRGFVARLAPEAVCEPCIASRLELSKPEAAGLSVNRLVGTDGFKRAYAPCALCGTSGTFIHKAQ